MSNAINFIYLNEKDMISADVMNMPKCIEAMEETFKLLELGDYRMGGPNANEHGIKVFFPQTSEIIGMPLNEPDKRFMAMPAYLGGKYHMFGIKSYGSNQKNRDKGLPRSILMMSLMEVETGVPLAYMSANILSAMRTGAVTGLGFKYLAKKNSEVVAIVGPGVMARYAMEALIECQPSVRVVHIKGRSKKGIEEFIDNCKKKYPQIEKYVICSSVEEACNDADIVYFGTTNAVDFDKNPYINENWIKKGALVVSASALLVDTDFISNTNKCKLIADNYQMYEDWGSGQQLPTQKNVSSLLGMAFYDAICEKKIHKNDITNIGKIINGEMPGRTSEEQIILYAVGGMPIEDVAWGYECYKNAQEKGIGITLNLWDDSKL